MKLFDKMELHHKYLLLIISIAIFLRMYNIGVSGTGLLTLDEVAETVVASNNLNNLINAIRALEYAPPLYYFLLHFWMYIGKTEFILRSFSAVAGVFSVAMIYLVGKELFNKKVGLIGALLLATSPFHVWASQITRHYSLFVFLTLCSVYFFIRILNSARADRKLWYGFIITSLAMIYTHYYSFLIIIAANILAICLYKDRKFYTNWILSQIALFILYIPWLPFAFLSIGRRVQDYHGASIGSILIDIPLTFEYFSIGILHTFNSWKFDQIILILAMVIYFSLFMIGLYELRNSKPSRMILLSFLFIPLIIAFIYGFKIGSPAPRFIIHISFAFYIILALALSNIRDKRILAGLLVCIMLISVGTIYQNEVYFRSIAKNDIPAISEYINAYSENNDIILISDRLSELHLAYYYTGSLEMYGLPEDFDWEYGISKPLEVSDGNMDIVIQSIQNYTDGRKRFWYINIKQNDTAQFIQKLKNDAGNIDKKNGLTTGGDMVNEFLNQNYKLLLKNETISEKYKLYLYEI